MGPEGFQKLKDLLVDTGVSAMVGDGTLSPFLHGEDMEFVTVSVGKTVPAPHARILNTLGKAGYVYREEVPRDGSGLNPLLERVTSTERSITFRDRNYPTSI